MAKVDKIIFFLGLVFLFLSGIHFYLALQSYSIPDLLDRKIVSCIGDEELFGYTDELGWPGLLNTTNSPLCISKEYGNKIEALVKDLNNTGKKTNFIAAIGYLIAGSLTIWDSKRKINNS